MGFSGPVHFISETRADHFGFLTGALGLFTLVIVAYLFLRPAEPPGGCAAQDAEPIRELLDRHGEQDSLGYFALRTDKSVIWSPTGKSCIGYRVLSGVMLASGDPIGDPEAWPGAIQAFLDEAARHAWVPAVIGCGEQGAEVWCREGELTALELGDEAVVSVADFTMQGRSMRNVRQMVSRVCRQGYEAQVRRVGDIPEDEIKRLVRQADSWRGSPTERGFSMALGRVGGPGDDRCVIATATEDGVLRAILHFVPVGQRRAVAGPDAPGPLGRARPERLPDRRDHQEACGDLGVKRISLNFAVFRAALERGERDRCRAGAARLAPGPAVHVPLVPDRVAVQVQRQVLPAVGAEVPGLPEHQGRAADRRWPRWRPRRSWSGRPWRSAAARAARKLGLGRAAPAARPAATGRPRSAAASR